MSLEWGAIVGLFLTLLGHALYLGSQFGALKVKVDTIWEFFMRRGAVEAQVAGLIGRNSPLTVSEKAREAFAPIIPKLKTLHTQHPQLSQYEFTLLIEQEFGEWISEQVCLPLKLRLGACLVTAYYICLDPSPTTSTPQNPSLHFS